MPQSPWENISHQTIHELVQQTFSLLLEREAYPAPILNDAGEDDLSMGVYCDPCQQSAVVIRCSRALAMSLTGQLLELEQEDIREEDRIDAVGELVNVIAGSLRGLLPILQTMSTPFTLSSQDLARVARNGSNLTYRVDDEPFHLYTVMNHHE